MRSLVIGIAFLFLDFNEARAASFFDGQTCFVSRGYESLEKLNQDETQTRMCQSKKSSCYAITGDLFIEKCYFIKIFFFKFQKEHSTKVGI